MGLNLGSRSACFHVFPWLAQSPASSTAAVTLLAVPHPGPLHGPCHRYRAQDPGKHRHSTVPHPVLLQGALKGPEPVRVFAPLNPCLLWLKVGVSREVCAHCDTAVTLPGTPTAAPDRAGHTGSPWPGLQHPPAPFPTAPGTSPISLGTETLHL